MDDKAFLKGYPAILNHNEVLTIHLQAKTHPALQAKIGRDSSESQVKNKSTIRYSCSVT